MPAARRLPDAQARVNARHAKALQNSLGRDSDYLRNRYRDYFTRLDLESDRRLVPHYITDRHKAGAREQAVTYMIATLRNRLKQRVGRLGKKDKTLQPLSGRLAKSRAQLLSKMQLDLVKEFFPARGAEPVDQAQFDDAFEMFSNGELRRTLSAVGRTAGDAASGYVFFFAEFALTCIESDIDKADWERLAPVMVRSQAISARVYELDGLDKARYRGKHTSLTRVERDRLARPEPTLEDLARAHSMNAYSAGVSLPSGTQPGADYIRPVPGIHSPIGATGARNKFLALPPVADAKIDTKGAGFFWAKTGADMNEFKRQIDELSERLGPAGVDSGNPPPDPG